MTGSYKAALFTSLPAGPVPVEALTECYELLDATSFQSCSHRRGVSGEPRAVRGLGVK